MAGKGFCPLASGSSGNVSYLGTDKVKILFDAGISFKSLKERLSDIDVKIEEIDAVVISHEHTDHVKAVEMITKKTNIPIFCNSDTAKMLCQTMEVRPKLKIFSTGEEFTFGDVTIQPFSIQHDTVDPVAFTIVFKGIKIGICTDLGFATKLVKHHLLDCDYIILEANHDEELVHLSSRPMVYKQRVLSRQGHLSNTACGQLLSEVHSPKLKHVFLAHLSSECNKEELALQTVRDILKQEGKRVDMSIAYPDKVSRFISFEEPRPSKVSAK